MNDLEPINQLRLIGLDRYFFELNNLFNQKLLPNKILISGAKGIGKSTLAYHFINNILSKNETFSYDERNFLINEDSQTFKTINNKSNTNFILIDIDDQKKNIEINQIRKLISNLNKSSFNSSPRFVLIDNIELLNINSINALLKIIEEPSENTYFILINSNKKILSTLTSRCINFKIFITHKESQEISNILLGNKINDIINKDLINYYSTPGNLFRLVKFAEKNNYNLNDINLKKLLEIIINDNQYKKANNLKYIFFELLEFYLSKINFTINSTTQHKYSYFLNRISDTNKFNLDEESLFIEFKESILNG